MTLARSIPTISPPLPRLAGHSVGSLGWQPTVDEGITATPTRDSGARPRYERPAHQGDQHRAVLAMEQPCSNDRRTTTGGSRSPLKVFRGGPTHAHCGTRCAQHLQVRGTIPTAVNRRQQKKYWLAYFAVISLRRALYSAIAASTAFSLPAEDPATHPSTLSAPFIAVDEEA
jgi:hypothetical protein